MKKTIKLVALDLDGTLLNYEKQVSARTIAVFRECEKQGIQIVPSTGRAKNAVPETILTLPGVHYGIFTNGASVWDIKEDKEIASGCIDWRTARETAQVLRRYPLIYDMYIGGTGVCERHFLDVLEEFGFPEFHCRFIRETRKTVEDICTYLEETHAKVQKLNLSFRQEDRAVREAVRKDLDRLSGLLVTSSMPWNLELNAAGVTKGSGLLQLSHFLGLSAEETMACGDGENDLPMLLAAGIGVCMENGASFVKKKADRITLSNDQDGVAAAIEQWVLKK